MSKIGNLLIEAAEMYEKKHPGCTWEEACEKCDEEFQYLLERFDQ